MLAIRARRAIVVAMLGCAGALSSSANAAVLFQDTFEAGYLDWHWSHAFLQQDSAVFTTFNGRHNNSYTQLNLTAVPPPIGQNINGEVPGAGSGGSYIQYTVTFDFYAFDTWDGDDLLYGRDFMNVLVNNTTVFSNTFANQPGCAQSFREPDVGRTQLGGRSGAWDSIYRSISIPFSVGSASSIAIKWQDGGLQVANDESWAIDNVRVTYEVVPTPGVAGVLGAAGLCASRRRRRH